MLVTHNHELCERLQEKGIGRYLQGEFLPARPDLSFDSGRIRVSHADRVAAALGFSKERCGKAPCGCGNAPHAHEPDEAKERAYSGIRIVDIRRERPD